MAKDFKPKPLVAVNLVTEFGGVEDLEEFRNGEDPLARDYLRVPGPSEKRYERDQAIAAHFRGEIKGDEVPVLTHNARWFRAVKGSGSDPDNTRLIHAKNEGYRPVMQSDIGPGKVITALPPGAQVAADGTIKTAGGDLVLFIADQKTAARNAMRKKIRAEESVDGMEFQAGGLGEVGAKAKADPLVEKTIGGITK